MVLKPLATCWLAWAQFESDVISDGTQTHIQHIIPVCLFESDVISDGTQTYTQRLALLPSFESDVISDGTQTNFYSKKP